MIELLTLFLLAGALLYHSLGINLVGIGIISALASAFFFIYFLSKKALLLGLLFGVSVFLGAVTMWQHAIVVPKTFFSTRVISGTVERVDRRLDKTIVAVHDHSFDQLIQVTLHSQTVVLPGDTVIVTGDIQPPTDFLTASGRLFAYHDYLQSKDIVGIIPSGTITITASGRFSPVRLATVWRFAIADVYTRYIAFPIDGIVAGIVVGYQGGVPQTIEDLFRTTGVLHVLVLSGENITLLAIFLSIILRPVPFRIRVALTTVAIVLVVLISGAGVSAIRAGIMGVIALSAGLVKRGYVPLRALTLSVLFFFFLSPDIIFADPGFHLSVLATIFMLVVLPKMRPLFRWLPDKYHVQELVMLASGVPIFMLPYTMYFSGLVPAASPFANVLMVLVNPLMMLCGAITLALSWCVPIAQLFGTMVSWLGNLVLKLLSILNRLPQLNTPPVAWWGVVTIYILFFVIVFRFEIKQFVYDQQLRR